MFSVPDTPPVFLLSVAATYLAALLIVLLFAKLSALLTLRAVQKVWHNRRTIISEYDPPLGLAPEELGYIFDRSFSDSELAAVVIQLVQKKFLTITVSSGGWLLHATAQKSPEALGGAQSIVLREISRQPKARILWKDLSSTYSELIGVQGDSETAITGSLAGKDLVSVEGYGSLLALRQSTGWLIGTMLSIFTIWVPLLLIRRASHSTGLAPEYQDLDEFLTILLLLPLFGATVWLLQCYSSFVAYIYYRGAGLPIGATAKLRHAWPDVVGYREYLMTVEFNRLEISGTIDDPVLPYCVALGFNMMKIKPGG